MFIYKTFVNTQPRWSDHELTQLAYLFVNECRIR
jgi:hypothetical protein